MARGSCDSPLAFCAVLVGSVGSGVGGEMLDLLPFRLGCGLKGGRARVYVWMDTFIWTLMGAGQGSEGWGCALNVTHRVSLLVVTGLLRMKQWNSEYGVAERVRTTYIKVLVFRVPEYASRRL